MIIERFQDTKLIYKSQLLNWNLKLKTHYHLYPGFPDSSVGKESTCNAGDPGSIPGLARSYGEGISYPLWYSWVSLMAQLVKNLPAMQDPWVGEIPWNKGKATHSGIVAWRIPWTTVLGDAKSQTQLTDFCFTLLEQLRIFIVLMYMALLQKGRFTMK